MVVNCSYELLNSRLLYPYIFFNVCRKPWMQSVRNWKLTTPPLQLHLLSAIPYCTDSTGWPRLGAEAPPCMASWDTPFNGYCLSHSWDRAAWLNFLYMKRASQVVLVVKTPPPRAGDTGDVVSIPGLGRSSGGGHGNPPQYSCLENPKDRGTLRVHRVEKVGHNWSDLAHMYTLWEVTVTKMKKLKKKIWQFEEEIFMSDRIKSLARGKIILLNISVVLSMEQSAGEEPGMDKLRHV